MKKTEKITVRDCYQNLSPVPDKLSKDASLPDIIKLLARYKSCRSVFVVDKNNKLKGIVTAKSLIKILGKTHAADFNIPRMGDILAQTAEDFMIPARYVTLNDTIEDALKKAALFELEDLPVIENDEIVGVIDCFELLLNAPNIT
ncbi:MAG: CBS domain-containing protein [Proteobacteria bacterium]|nr:CBS domain-containing protein [Pseudomonadota bacterium]